MLTNEISIYEKNSTIFLSLTSNGQACPYYSLNYIGEIECELLNATQIALPSLKYLLKKREVKEQFFYELKDNEINIERVARSSFMPACLFEYLQSKHKYLLVTIRATTENGAEVEKNITIDFKKINFSGTKYEFVLDIGLVRI